MATGLLLAHSWKWDRLEDLLVEYFGQQQLHRFCDWFHVDLEIETLYVPGILDLQ